MNKYWFILFLSILAACKVHDNTSVQQDPTYVRQFHSGVRNMLNKEYELAIQEFKECLQKQPKDAAVHYALFQTYLKQERYQEAAYHTEQAAALDPKNLHYKRELAFMYQQLGKAQEAAEVFEELITADPKNIDYYSGALISYEQLHKPAKSLALIQKMELQLGENPSTVLEKFRLLQQLGKTKESTALLEEARLRFPSEPSILANLVDTYFRAQNYTAAFGILKDLVEADPSNGVAQLMYGEMLYRSGQQEKGKTHLSAGILAEGASLDQKMNILIMMINESKGKGVDPAMEPLVVYMTQTYPKEAKAHSIAGDYYYVAGNILQAIESYRQTLRCDPNLYPVWNQVLLLEFEQNRWTYLQQDAAQCVELFPNQALPLFLKGLTLNRIGSYGQAKESLLAAESVLVNDNALLAEIYGQLAVAYFGLKDNNKAMAQFKQAQQLNEGNLTLELCYIQALIKNQIEPEKTQERLAQLLQKSAEPLCIHLYAFSFFEQGQYAKALEWQLKITDQKFIQSPIYQEQLGDIYFKLGQLQDALLFWKKAQELGEGSPVLHEKITQKNYVQAP